MRRIRKIGGKIGLAPGTLNKQFKWMFVETTIFYVMIWNHPNETTINKQMFQVPGDDI